ncbi:ABC transporter substrate-binding protein [Acuticoccus sp. MNP-M23]|uniref:ABC transporter substrate-binding protein n=1 Tax=Acuticoccus sp. MNP-M23 TaxID=3072793 RepID=UPI002814CE56|nr:ABC transporter substrate-binding protein [Acuticoccus sp. MNP-M23]WMS43506.1 ABC transporter substrate-binding protein [Acuticoccus sp. MNP-M23]
MKRTILNLSTAAVALLAASAVSAETLRWANDGDVLTLDPYAHTESLTSSFLHHLYEPLVRRNADLGFEPALATEWELIEPTRARFKLREGVTFHNGNPFTADDVVASITRMIDPDSRARGNLSAVTAAEKVDDLTVDLILTGPTPLLLNDLSGVFMMDKEWMEEHDALTPGNTTTGTVTYASDHANGTGPFKLESRTPDAKTVLTAFDDWWDTPIHNIDTIEFTPIGSDATRVAALLSGEVDVITPAPLQDTARIDGADGVSAIQNPSLRTIMLGLNVGDDELDAAPGSGFNPLKDVKVRKALWQAIDMDAIAAKVMRGKARVAGLMIAPQIAGYVAEDDVKPEYDMDAAKKLLADAGYEDGFTMGLDCPNDRYVNDEEICLAIASMWKNLGVDVKLTTQTKGNHFPKVDNGETDAYMIGWATLPAMDGYSPVRAMLATRDGEMGGNNPNGYSNARVDEIAKLAGEETDDEKRLAMISEAIRIARDEIAFIPLHQQPLAWAARDNVELIQFPDNYFRAWHYKVN